MHFWYKFGLIVTKFEMDSDMNIMIWVESQDK
jgi:hypothetical protein